MTATATTTYFAVRKAGSLGEASAVVTELTPEWEALAAFTPPEPVMWTPWEHFTKLEDVRRYFLQASSNRLTTCYRGQFARRAGTP